MLDRNVAAAARAATIRVGSTSAASIEREMSTASTIVASSRFVVSVASGRATPTSMAARAASRTASGMSRRARGGRGDDLRQQPGAREALGAPGRVAARARRTRRDERQQRAGASKRQRRLEAHRPLPLQEDGERAQPVAGRGQHVVTDPERGERARDAGAILRGGGGEALAQLRAAGVDAQLAARLRVDEEELAHVRQLLLAGIADLHARARRGVRRARAAGGASRSGRGSRRRRPRARAGGRARRCGAAPRRARSRRRCPPPVSSRRRAASSPSRPIRPCRGGSARGSWSPNVTTPSRLPRRVATCPSAIAAPSATSDLRRSAVPKPIDGDVSSTSQLTSTRSARWTRTCGSAVRAVDVPVDPAHVVAGDVGPDERELGPFAVEARAVVPRQQAAHAPPDRDVERAQQRLGHRPRVGGGAEWRGGGAELHLLDLKPRSSSARGRSSAPPRRRGPGRGSTRRRPPRRAPGRSGSSRWRSASFASAWMSSAST